MCCVTLLLGFILEFPEMKPGPGELLSPPESYAEGSVYLRAYDYNTREFG